MKMGLLSRSPGLRKAGQSATDPSSSSRFFSGAGELRVLEQVSDCLFHHLAINNRDGRGQWNVLGTDLHTVPSVTALVNSTIARHYV